MTIYSTKKLVLALATSIAIGGSITLASGQVIYSDTLTGTVGPDNNPGNQYTPPTDPYTPDPLNGSAPDTANSTPAQQWTADANWQRTASGTGFAYNVGPTSGDAAYLPFSPTVGSSYVLQATFSPSQYADYANNTEFGFVNTPALNPGYNAALNVAGRVSTITLNSGYPDDSVSFNVNGNYGGNTGDTASFANGGYTDQMTVDITLTSTLTGWNVVYSGFDSTTDPNDLTPLFTSGAYALTDAQGAGIGALGFASLTGNSIVSNLSLTEVAAAPEPSTWGLLIAGSLLLFGLRLRKKSSV